MPTTAASDYLTLTAMITPALFMTASGSLIISTSNRMSRIVDRIRVLNDLGDALDRGETGLDYVRERRAHVLDQIGRLEWRGGRIRVALIMLYLGLAALVGTSLALALDEEGRLSGILTDGDLRRLLQGRLPSDTPVDLRRVKAADWMSPRPRTIGPDALATEALRRMEEHSITSLVVGDDGGQPLGVIHLHDLWRTGMV